MRTAMKQDGGLGSPSVGTWFPDVGLGAPLQAGQRLGRLRRAGGWLEVTVPRGVAGVVTGGAARGAWVAFDDVLVTVGEGGAVGGFAPAVAPVEADVPEGAVVVRADTDGTVYLSPKPGQPPFVREGGAVDAAATLALVEVMKTFTPVRAPVSGTVVGVRVDDGGAVRAGEGLFWIEPV